MEMKHCPFCGSAGKLNNEVRTRMEKIKEEEVADTLVETAKGKGLVGVKQKCSVVNDFGEKSDGWAVYYECRMFIPRCSNKRCIANHIRISYSNEDRAISAWNAREGK